MHSRTQLAIYGLRNYFMPGLNDATVALNAGGVRIASLYSILRLLLLGKGDSALVYGRSLCREHGGIFWRCRRCVTTGKPSLQGFSGASVASARLSKCGWNIGQWVTAATACSREAMDFAYGAIAALAWSAKRVHSQPHSAADDSEKALSDLARNHSARRLAIGLHAPALNVPAAVIVGPTLDCRLGKSALRSFDLRFTSDTSELRQRRTTSGLAKASPRQTY